LTQAAAAIRPTLAPPTAPPPTAAEVQGAQQKRHNRERRLVRYEQVAQLHRQGKTKRQIARELGLDRRTVRRWLRAGSYPERKSTSRSSSLDAYLGYLEDCLQQGCRNAAQLWRDLRERGFGGQPGIVRRWLRQRCGARAERSRREGKWKSQRDFQLFLTSRRPRNTRCRW